MLQPIHINAFNSSFDSCLNIIIVSQQSVVHTSLTTSEGKKSQGAMMSNLGGRVKTRKLVKTWFSEKKQNIMCFSVQWDNPSISTRPD